MSSGIVPIKQGSMADELILAESTAQKSASQAASITFNYKRADMSTLSDIFVTRYASQPQVPFDSNSLQMMYANFKTIIVTDQITKVSKAITFKGSRVFDRDQFGDYQSDNLQANSALSAFSAHGSYQPAEGA